MSGSYSIVIYIFNQILVNTFNINSITFIKIVHLKTLMHSKISYVRPKEYTGNTVESFQFFERLKGM